MNELEVFNHDSFGSVRTLTESGAPWFIATDVCMALDIQNTADAVKRLDDDEKYRFNLGLPGGDTWCINEPGLYTLVLGSRKPEAKAFKRWITHDVIPAIRRTGSYSVKGAAISSADYMKAAQIVSKCPNKRLPIVLSLLEAGGINVEAVVAAGQTGSLMETAKPTRVPNKYTEQYTLSQEERDAMADEALDIVWNCPMTLTEMAKITGIGRANLSQIRHGYRRAGPDRAKIIISALKPYMSKDAE